MEIVELPQSCTKDLARDKTKRREVKRGLCPKPDVLHLPLLVDPFGLSVQGAVADGQRYHLYPRQPHADHESIHSDAPSIRRITWLAGRGPASDVGRARIV